jgi:thiol:disulfide interchange protein
MRLQRALAALGWALSFALVALMLAFSALYLWSSAMGVPDWEWLQKPWVVRP